MSFCLSIVSHGQAGLANLLLDDLDKVMKPDRLILTINTADAQALQPRGLDAQMINNSHPMGFGANHNQAFQQTSEPFFCVCNPDIRLPTDPFPALLDAMKDPSVGVVAPMVLNPAGLTEDSARHFPTPMGLVRKALWGEDGRYPMAAAASGPHPPQPVDWAAGMFLFFRASAFRDVGGFDDKFHLYYEDVDICTRLWDAGWKVMLHPGASVIHSAQRASHRNPRYMAWHATSMARYFLKHMRRPPRTPETPG